MQRANYIKITAIATFFLLTGCLSNKTKSISYNIKVDSNRGIGHLLRDNSEKLTVEKFSVKTVVVGGGVAGVAAYTALNGEDCMLFDLNSYLGGSAGGGNFKSSRFARGAHYDVIYPANYDKETLNLLERSDIIVYDSFNDKYHYKDAHFVIAEQKENTCIRNGKKVGSPLEGFAELAKFKQILLPFKGEMPMPVRNINKRYHYLNNLSFKKWLLRQEHFSEAFLDAVSYQMKDDWGADVSKVSALAGIHYYMCRDYEKSLELISPPEGNLYFVEKMLATSNYENLFLNHLVEKITPQSNGGFIVSVLDIERKVKKEISCEKVIYAGQKHALKYVCPQAARLDLLARYIPWVSVNVVLKKGDRNNAFWQNDFISDDKTFLGFSDSDAQFDFNQKYRVLTAYYCFDISERKKLKEIEQSPNKFVTKTISYIEESLGKEISMDVEFVNVNLMGHAMPLAEPGYLFKDWNKNRPLKNFSYAGVDVGNLPLFFEAVNSGISAVNALKN